MINPESLLGCSGADEAPVRGILDVRIAVAHDRAPAEMSKMLPALEKDPTIEGLSLGGGNDAIVLAPRARVGFAPV